MGERISFWMIMGLWSATYFVTLLPISINGMGVQELAMTFFYSAIGGISQPSGLTLALLMRALQMLASLPGALFIPDILAGRK
jgi:glycosyltransferase 2 family protein